MEHESSTRFTARLRLEPVGPANAGDLWLVHNDDEVAPWYEGRKLSAEEAEQRAKFMGDSWRSHGVHKWIAYDRVSGEVVGRGGLSRTPVDDDWGQIYALLPPEPWVRLAHEADHPFKAHAHWLEIGWALRRKFWGHGYASEIGRAGLEFAFDVLGAQAVVSCTVRHNVRSRAVMERIGMRYAGEIRSRGVVEGLSGEQDDAPFVVFVLLRRDLNGSLRTPADRERLAATFDRAAELYQRARPDYPDELYDELVAVTELSPGAHLLEVGSATGKATLPLARRGFRITCLEPGAALAAAARRNLKAFGVEVIQTRFEDWTPPPDPFAMVFAATSWHWVDPAVRYQKAAQVLEPGGYLAVWGAGHVFPDDGDPFFEELQEIYDEIGEALPPDSVRPRPQELADDRGEIESSGLFDVVTLSQYDWESVYDADRYIDLLNTFSGHIAMQDWQRDRLYGEIRRRLSRRPDGLLRRHWGGVLQVARRRQ